MITTNHVNFLRRSRRRVEQYQQFDKIALQVSGVVFAICVAVTVGMFAYWQYISNQLRDLKDANAAQQRVITRAAKEEAEYLLFTSQLDSVGTLLSARQSKKEALDFLSRLAVDGISFDRITYSALSRALQFRVQTESVFPVENFLDRLKSETSKISALDVTMSGIKRDDVGRYYLEVMVILPAPPGAQKAKK